MGLRWNVAHSAAIVTVDVGHSRRRLSFVTDLFALVVKNAVCCAEVVRGIVPVVGAVLPILRRVIPVVGTVLPVLRAIVPIKRFLGEGSPGSGYGNQDNPDK